METVIFQQRYSFVVGFHEGDDYKEFLVRATKRLIRISTNEERPTLIHQHWNPDVNAEIDIPKVEEFVKEYFEKNPPEFGETHPCYFCGRKASNKVRFYVPASDSYVTDWVCADDTAVAKMRNVNAPD